MIIVEKIQDEIINAGGQIEPPGMHMIYLPYSDDIRHIEEARENIQVVLNKFGGIIKLALLNMVAYFSFILIQMVCLEQMMIKLKRQLL